MSTTQTAPQEIDTAHVLNRRTLRFERIEEALAEARRLAEAERAGTLTRLGNWTFGQALGHLGSWAGYSYTGAPLTVPLPIRLMLRLGKNKFLNGAMRPGVRIPKVPGGTLAIDPLPFEEGLARFESSFDRLKREVPMKPNVIFGPLTHAQWIALNLRHCELHLSFFERARAN